MHRMIEKLEQNQKQLYLSLAATYIWGLFAHGYAFGSNIFNHDSLRELHGSILGNRIKMGSGRVITPIYRALIGTNVTLPWMIGLMALLWIGLAVFLIVRLFRMESPGMIVLTAGVCTVNIAVSATTATYIHDLDCYMFSMLCAVTAAWLWKSHLWGWLPGSLFVAVSLGIYQCFVFVAVTLIMMVCILDLLNERAAQSVFTDGLKAIVMLILGGILYYGMMKIILSLTGVQLTKGDYNSLDRVQALSLSTLVPQAMGAYRECIYRLVNAYNAYPSIMVKGITVLLLTVSFAAIAVGVGNRKVKPAAKGLCVLLVILLPLGMNMIQVLTVEKNHDLMTYPIWMFYILALVLANWLQQRWKICGDGRKILTYVLNGQRILCILLVFVLLYGSTWFANGMYLKKGLEHEAYMSLMTRIVARMEMVEDYVPGETEVVFVGLPDNLNPVIPGFKDYWNVTGMTKSDMIYSRGRDRFQAYFDYMLSLPIRLASEEIWNSAEQMETVQQMPVYPARGSIQMLDGILFVKLEKD